MRTRRVDGLDAEIAARVAALKERSFEFHEWVRTLQAEELRAAASQIRQEVGELADEGEQIRAMHEDLLMQELKPTG